MEGRGGEVVRDICPCMDPCSGAAEPNLRLYVGGIIMGGGCGGEPQEEEEEC